MKERKSKDLTLSKATMDIENGTDLKECRINKELLRFKLNYFLLCGAVGAIIIYVPLIAMEKIKLSPTTFAVTVVGRQFFIMLGKIIFGYIADYFNNLKFLFSLLTIVQVVFVFLLLLVPPITVDYTKNQEEVLCTEINDTNNCQCVNSSSDALFNASIGNNKNETLSLSTTKSENRFTICSNVKNDSYQICHSGSCNTSHYFEKNIDHWNSSHSLNSSRLFCSSSLNDFCAEHQNINRTCCLIKKPLTIDSQNKSHLIKDITTYQFWAFFVIFTVVGVSGQIGFTLLTTACVEAAQKYNAEFGKQIMWNGPGWAIFATLSGFLNDYTSSYFPAFCLYTALALLVVLNTCQMNLNKATFPKTLLKNVGTVIKSKDFLSFQTGILLNGVGFGIIWFYLCWFIRSLNGNQLICGLYTLVHIIGEIPFLYFSGKIGKMISHFNIITCALLTYCFRFLWLSHIQNPWHALVFEWGNGISFNLLVPTMASFAKLKSVPGTETTLQAIISATHDDLGTAIGNIIAGVGFDYLGGSWTFFYLSIYFACCLPISVYLSFLNKK